jgi:hypothetical protein
MHLVVGRADEVRACPGTRAGASVGTGPDQLSDLSVAMSSSLRLAGTK